MTDAENRELAGYFGICWHKPFPMNDTRYGYCQYCGLWALDKVNPDFSDPRVVLREMRKREDFVGFCERYLNDGDYGWVPYILDENHEGLLARAALEWFRKQKEE